MTDHTYPVSYRLERNDPPLSAEEAAEEALEGMGSCDAAVVLSILFPEDGSYWCLRRSRRFQPRRCFVRPGPGPR
jgi:hypothetical protein